MDVKKLFADFFMYSYLLLLHWQTRLTKAFFSISLQMAKHKVLVACLIAVPAIIGFMLHVKTATLPFLFIMMTTIILLMKKEAKADGFKKGLFP